MCIINKYINIYVHHHCCCIDNKFIKFERILIFHRKCLAEAFSCFLNVNYKKSFFRMPPSSVSNATSSLEINATQKRVF